MDEEDRNFKQLVADLRSYDKEKRRIAVVKLGLLGNNEAIKILIWTVQNTHEDLLTRAKAALMLGKLREPKAVDALIQALSAPGLHTPVYAAQALGNIGEPRAINSLLEALHPGHDTLNEEVYKALEKLGYDSSEREVAVHDFV